MNRAVGNSGRDRLPLLCREADQWLKQTGRLQIDLSHVGPKLQNAPMAFELCIRHSGEEFVNGFSCDAGAAACIGNGKLDAIAVQSFQPLANPSPDSRRIDGLAVGASRDQMLTSIVQRYQFVGNNHQKTSLCNVGERVTFDCGEATALIPGNVNGD
jgi:hypothetical protein